MKTPDTAALRAPMVVCLGISVALGCGSESADTLSSGVASGGRAGEPGSPALIASGGGVTIATGGTTVGNAGAAGAAPTARCGDGLLASEETCDDGNTTPVDGCDGTCQTESGFVCETPGEPCKSTLVCGDELPGPDEACDDGNTVSGDGCSADCTTVEPGFSCPPSGPCSLAQGDCGNAQLDDGEQCDDGQSPMTSGDGCSEGCKYEPGWVCPEGEPCRPTVCGDGALEGSEQCDDGNLRPYDGCSPSCVNEPVCGTETSPVGECISMCGDGIVLSSELCDDSTTKPGMVVVPRVNPRRGSSARRCRTCRPTPSTSPSSIATS